MDLWLNSLTLVITYEFSCQNYEKVGVYSCAPDQSGVLQNYGDFSEFFGEKPDLGSKSNGVTPLSSENREFFLTV